MRILAIGMGGAGCRIAEALYANDRKSSKVTCVQALVVDIDSGALVQLKTLPELSKIDFSSIEPGISGQGPEFPQSPATIDIGEIMARIQNIERGETDAILLCCGLGGRMADAMPQLISAIRESVTEPIFGLVTLPALSEGERKSAKAADDIDAISPLLDGTILFDNETWLKKIAARRDVLLEELSKGPGLFGLGRNPPKLSAQEITNKLLNQSIIRRISLLLRAGEFRADGGIDLAEVVMDSSEVLNTINGMGFISIGYAVQHLSQGPLAFLSRLRTDNASLEQRKSAERIIELAKQAIYQEVSIPCDMTSAAKALILVAGPSHEISMKGFMTVRKWIDRSIAGMEMRSGDYPVTNSENVAIIVVLSGLENIPRITELREIREQYRTGVSRDTASSLNLPPVGNLRTTGGASAIPTVWSGTELRDDMISLPGENPKKRGPHRHLGDEFDLVPETSAPPVRVSTSAPREVSRQQAVRPRILEERKGGGETQHPASPVSVDGPVKPAVSQRVPPIMPLGKSEDTTGHHPSPQKKGYGIISPGQEIRPPPRRTLESGYEGSLPLKPTPVKSRTPVHQIPEQETQMIVKPGLHESRDTPVQAWSSPPPETKTIIRRVTAKAPIREAAPLVETAAKAPAKTERTIIRQRKKETGNEDGLAHEEPSDRKGTVRQEELELAIEMEEFSAPAHQEEMKIGIKDRLQPVRDDIFLGKSVSLKEPLRVKDDALLHTEIKTKKGRPGTEDEESARVPESAFPSPGKKTGGKSSVQDDKIS